MRIAFIGSRGIPKCYSGFETFVEEVATRLAARGHEVTVYNRIPFNRYPHNTYKGVRIIRIPTIPTKATDTLLHTALCTLHGLLQRFQIIIICGVGNSIYSSLWKTFGVKTLVNVDGADWARAKWGAVGRRWLRWSEQVAASQADIVIADHPVIAERYKREFGIEAAIISYGAEVLETDPGQNWLQKLNLQPKQYFLFVSRLTPENGAAEVMQDYLDSGVSLPLVVVGDAPYQSAYKARLQALAAQSNGRIRMTGFLFGDGYVQLSYHALAYIYPTAIDATRPVLLEQMGMGAVVLSRDTPANRHILADAALYFDPLDAKALPQLFRYAEQNPAQFAELSQRARERIRRNYNWEDVVTSYERLFEKLLENKRP